MSKREQWLDDLLTGDEPPQRQKPKADNWLERNIKNVFAVLTAMGFAIAYYGNGSLRLFGIILGVVSLVLIVVFAWADTQRDVAQKVQDEQDFAYAQSTHFQRLTQRPELVGTLSSVEIERYRAEGAFDAMQLAFLQAERGIQLSHEEAERVRAHDSSEAMRNRRHESQQSFQQHRHESQQSKQQHRHEFNLAKTRLEMEMQVLQARLAIQHPSEVDTTREKLDAFRLEQMTWEAIENMDEGDEKWRRMEAFTRRLDSK